ncbi:glycosyltransferase involved in cell wall biosynthesis [Gillisia sp. Hel_I_86]|uniref:glycosyltransferase family 4 protein n=1 Tax=Gillisia sp. Hel_I_86 TaxID=1249981 RepID=UPI00119AD787|nr:glycosyltransferase family 4 protein [Gillisia sp. Hel_I_86]TVZ28226.1 glycosyltransferase involved in cell wall biosynthesis [Gillisia sp. Hel_I_86]
MDKKIKVLFIIDTLETGGAEKSLVKIAINFKNVTPVFLQIYQGSTLSSILLANGIQVTNLDIVPGYHFKRIIKLLIPIVEEINPDIIHTTLFKSDIIGRKLKRHFNVPLVNSLVNNSYIKQRYTNLNYYGKLKLYLFQLYDRFTCRDVDLFISNSKAIQATNASALKIPLNKIQVIHRGRDINEFKQIGINKIQELKDEIGIANKTILLNVSRLLARKGQLDLLKAFKTVSKTYPNLVLLIAGEGQYRDILENFISKNNLQNKIKLLGSRNDIPSLLEISDIFVFPSWYEGLPGALIEAMMAETPIVASNIPENLECLAYDEAVIFRKGNIEDLTEKLIWALQNGKEMKEIAQKARESAIHKFEISQISDQYEKVYQDLINK